VNSGNDKGIRCLKKWSIQLLTIKRGRSGIQEMGVIAGRIKCNRRENEVSGKLLFNCRDWGKKAGRGTEVPKERMGQNGGQQHAANNLGEISAEKGGSELEG